MMKSKPTVIDQRNGRQVEQEYDEAVDEWSSVCCGYCGEPRYVDGDDEPWFEDHGVHHVGCAELAHSPARR